MYVSEASKEFKKCTVTCEPASVAFIYTGILHLFIRWKIMYSIIGGLSTSCPWGFLRSASTQTVWIRKKRETLVLVGSVGANEVKGDKVDLTA